MTNQSTETDIFDSARKTLESIMRQQISSSLQYDAIIDKKQRCLTTRSTLLAQIKNEQAEKKKFATLIQADLKNIKDFDNIQKTYNESLSALGVFCSQAEQKCAELQLHRGRLQGDMNKFSDQLTVYIVDVPQQLAKQNHIEEECSEQRMSIDKKESEIRKRNEIITQAQDAFNELQDAQQTMRNIFCELQREHYLKTAELQQIIQQRLLKEEKIKQGEISYGIQRETHQQRQIELNDSLELLTSLKFSLENVQRKMVQLEEELNKVHLICGEKDIIFDQRKQEGFISQQNIEYLNEEISNLETMLKITQQEIDQLSSELEIQQKNLAILTENKLKEREIIQNAEKNIEDFKIEVREFMNITNECEKYADQTSRMIDQLNEQILLEKTIIKEIGDQNESNRQKCKEMTQKQKEEIQNLSNINQEIMKSATSFNSFANVDVCAMFVEQRMKEMDNNKQEKEQSDQKREEERSERGKIQLQRSQDIEQLKKEEIYNKQTSKKMIQDAESALKEAKTKANFLSIEIEKKNSYIAQLEKSYKENASSSTRDSSILEKQIRKTIAEKERISEENEYQVKRLNEKLMKEKREKEEMIARLLREGEKEAREWERMKEEYFKDINKIKLQRERFLKDKDEKIERENQKDKQIKSRGGKTDSLRDAIATIEAETKKKEIQIAQIQRQIGEEIFKGKNNQEKCKLNQINEEMETAENQQIICKRNGLYKFSDKEESTSSPSSNSSVYKQPKCVKRSRKQRKEESKKSNSNSKKQQKSSSSDGDDDEEKSIESSEDIIKSKKINKNKKQRIYNNYSNSEDKDKKRITADPRSNTKIKRGALITTNTVSQAPNDPFTFTSTFAPTPAPLTTLFSGSATVKSKSTGKTGLRASASSSKHTNSPSSSALRGIPGLWGAQGFGVGEELFNFDFISG